MGAPINPNVVDAPQVEEENGLKNWSTTTTDIINSTFTLFQQAFQYIIAIGQKDIGNGGAGPISISVTGLYSSNYVNVNLISTTNPNIIISAVAVSNGSFSVTFSADPGVSAIINYQAFTQQPL